jgi:hypothetical protein
MRDLYSNLGVAVLLAAATYAADNTPAAVDLDGFDSALLAIEVGAGGIAFSNTNKVEFLLTHSDDDSVYEAVTIDDVLGLTAVGAGGIVKTLNSAHAAADVTLVGYIGGKRYLKLLADFSGTHGTGTPLSALVIKGNARILPVNT